MGGGEAPVPPHDAEFNMAESGADVDDFMIMKEPTDPESTVKHPESRFFNLMGGGATDDATNGDEMPANDPCRIQSTSGLFNLIEIKSDKQDLSFVEKVLLSSANIANLFNTVAPGCIKASSSASGKWFLDFKMLVNTGIHAAGFYGSKQIMAKVLANEGMLSEHEAQALSEDALAPGLYGALSRDRLALFYWQPEKKFSDARRGDISCNFIRYLLELCDNVYCCVEVENGSSDMSSLVQVTAKKVRTQLLQVSVVKTSDNDFKVRPGFKLKLPNISESSKPMWSEGFLRSALLISETYTPEKCLRRTDRQVVWNDLPNEFREWQLKYNVDLSKMQDDVFIRFAEAAKLEGFEDLKAKLKQLDDDKVAEDKKLQNTEDYLNEKKKILLQVLGDGLNAYLRLNYPWEESIYADRHQSKGSQLEGASISNFLEYTGKPVESNKQLLDDLECNIAKVLKVNGDMVFIGSEVQLRNFGDKKTFAIEGSSGRTSGPVIFHDILSLRPSSSCRDEVCKFKLTGDVGPVSTAHSFSLAKQVESGIFSWAKKKTDFNSVKFTDVRRPNVATFNMWMDSVAREEVSALHQRARLVDFVISHKAELGQTATDDDYLAQCVLADSDSVFYYVDQVYVGKCREKWDEILRTDGSLDDAGKAVPWCLDIYSTGRRKFFSSFFDFAEKAFFPFLKSSVTAELKEERELLKNSIAEKKSVLIAEFKFVFSNAADEGSRPRMILNKVEKVFRNESTAKLFMEVEEVLKVRSVWKALELVPMKQDLELQAGNPGHLVFPRCSKLENVADMDSTLAKVILLRTGEVLLFVKGAESPELELYHCRSLGADLKIPSTGHVHRFSRGTDLVAFDESTRFMAFYDEESAVIKIYNCGESFRQIIWTGVNIQLDSFNGSRNITMMEFIPGKEELLLADDTFRVRIFEAVSPGMMKARSIQLPASLVQLCVSPCGLYLIALCGVEVVSASVYRLDDAFEHMKTVDLPLDIKPESFHAKVVSFGTQVHLVIYDTKKQILQSLVLEATVASQTCELQRSTMGGDSLSATQVVKRSSCHELDYLYHVYDKYAASPPLMTSPRSLRLGLIVEVLQGDDYAIERKLVDHAKAVFEKLKEEKGKNFSSMAISFDFQLYGGEHLNVELQQINTADFLRKLLALVPVQIARAQNNSLKPLLNGLEMPADVSYSDAIQLSDIIRFGLYDAILESWSGPVKVISSMGKQSSGKSYLLNHLSGSLLDVAGGRCTDGVWMTTRSTDKCLYVILDFEGLGSFERSEQEDMLLSILNAAVSNITIFNKKDFHLDKEMEVVFERFQNGVSLVKEDDKLFKGLFYIAIKDVDAADVDDLRQEFYSKIAHICSKSEDNFFTRMYGGKIAVDAMPPFNRAEFHESISQIAETVEERLQESHKNGRSFLRDLKLVIAQISSKDWSPLDTKRIAFKVSLLRKHLKSAAALGCLEGTDSSKLVNFDSEELIGELPLCVNGQTFEVLDTGLQLMQYGEIDVIATVLEQLVPQFENVISRASDGNDEDWHLWLETFLGALADRRKARVLNWIKANTQEFSEDGDVQRLVLEAAAMVAEVKEKLVLCSCKCEDCFLRCILERAHLGRHSCKGSHRCSIFCSYCRDKRVAVPCRDVAGHQGLHDCKVKNHTCEDVCCFANKSSNCNKKCSLKAGHEGEHRCNSRQHMCERKCDLLLCKNTCVTPVELNDHGRHACHEKMCIMKCEMAGCNRKCAAEDHFHSEKHGVLHLCGNEHQCYKECEIKGNCEVITEVSKRTLTFHGKRSTFDYDHVSEQNGVRKECCIPIPPLEKEHQGEHMHTVKPNAVHFCEVKCEGCGYFCTLPIAHMGLHETTHGNMTQRTFVSESAELEIGGRKYEWGESGAAEMCNMHCKARGRGHIHLSTCEEPRGGVCSKVKVPDGARHETKRYGPDVDVPKDEFTHAAYWKNMRFKDPCAEDDQKQFAMCGHYCGSAEHNSSTGGNTTLQQKSYCNERLWHDPVPSLVQNAGTGYITDDGHHFVCNHSRDVANHVIFVVDTSGSMESADVFPTMAKFPRNRLGCVFEAMVRFIRTRLASNISDTMSVVLFHSTGTIFVELEAMTEAQVDRLRYGSGGTDYSSGLLKVEEVLLRSLKTALPPVVIFLSDGGNLGGLDPVHCVRKLKGIDPGLVLHTIMFGKDPNKKVLEDMAAVGDGTFQVSIDEIQLRRSFEGLAKSLHTKVASLI